MDYKELIVWKRSIELVVEVYEMTKAFPKDERYGITSQIRRSAISVPSNIAEGHGRKADADFARFLRIAFGSSAELETQLIIATKLGYLDVDQEEKLISLVTEIQKMLGSLMRKLRS